MLIFLIAISPFAILGLICTSWIIKEEWEMRKVRKTPKKLTCENGYDPDSPLVLRFQKLAGIDRKYGRFNLRNMV
jgi:hypothetical protein